MGKRVIAAESQDGAPPLYFAGYIDQGERWTCQWTTKRTHALWFDAAEAELEVKLLQQHVSHRRVVSPVPLGI